MKSRHFAVRLMTQNASRHRLSYSDMLDTVFSNKFTAAISLRIIEIIGFFIVLSISGLIFSRFSDKYYIQRHVNFSQNVESAHQILISPIYLAGILLCSVMAISSSRTYLSVFIWVTPSIFMFFAYNIFSSLSLLPTLSLLVSSLATISAFKVVVGSVK